MALIASGQVCMSIKRIYVHDKIYDAFRAALVEFVRNTPHGSATDPSTVIGPIQNTMQYEKVKSMFEEAVRQKWTIAVGGPEDEAQTKDRKGLLFQPTVIDNPPDDSRIVVEEPFGPIFPILRWTEEAEVISRANASDWGLGASVWSNDLAKANRMADQLEAGGVWINAHFQVAPNVPVGGHKASGIGVDWGVLGLKGWCNPQSFWTIKG